MIPAATVVQHYGQSNLTDRLRAALTAAGLDGKQLTPADPRGIAATMELAQAAGIKKGSSVLDIGAGLGGPSRYLAATFACHVTGIDLSPSFVEAATYLAARAGLTDKVTYELARAEALPYRDQSFDVAWTQHVAMNIADRRSLYREAYRVLHSGGRFAIDDVVAGNGEPLHFPVPWAHEPDANSLVTPAAMRTLLEDARFRVVDWADQTAAGVSWFPEQAKAGAQAPTVPPALGLQVAMGPAFAAMAANLGRNLSEGRAELIQAVLVRP
jgi:sarcosine/dimethylglycine N-methyltransferase